MKICAKCKLNKPITEFAKRSKSKDGKQSWCKICNNTNRMLWYNDNTEEWNSKRRDRKNSIRAAVNELKNQPCADCNQKFDPVCMDFDHIKNNKIASVSTLVQQGKSLKEILKEIAKCEIVCANCHRIRTKNRLSRVVQRQDR